jgi:transposase
MPTARSIAIGKIQSIPKHLRFTINDFNRKFPDDDSCLEHIKEQRFPGGMAKCVSKKCQGQDRKHHRINGRMCYSCEYCGTQIFPLAGTIFEKTSTSLRLWFYAMYLMSSTRCGISAKQIQRETGVTYKTAWRMFRQIRTLMSEDLQLEGPTVEMDETYYGGVRKHGTGRPMRGDRQKTPIVGIVERKGRVVAKAAADVKGSTLLGMVREHVLPKSTIYTDELPGYHGISYMQSKEGQPAGYDHRRIHHSSKVYVMGDIHTNSVEGFCSLIKRGIGGVYHSVSQKYLQSYLNEYSFRYNRRDQGTLIFNLVLDEVSKRVVVEKKPPASEVNRTDLSLPDASF